MDKTTCYIHNTDANIKRLTDKRYEFSPYSNPNFNTKPHIAYSPKRGVWWYTKMCGNRATGNYEQGVYGSDRRPIRDRL